MRTLLRIVVATTLLAGIGSAVTAAEEGEGATADAANAPLPEEYSCTFCHADAETFYDDTRHLLVAEADLATDIHWEMGLRCHACHGGNPDPAEYVDHRDDPGFRGPASPSDIPGFCGHCHSDIEYMRRYSPSARIDQEAEYWTSGHGRELKETGDANVANCVHCHGRHGIRAADDQQSLVYPTRVAETCATCHSDEEMMAGRSYHGRPLGHNQYDLWRESVHGRALLEKGDLSAPTCNDCHGNHGAMPPGVDSVANACGTCHGKVAKLFAETQMKHKFEEVGLPGCAACHGNHETTSPSDEMLGMQGSAVCVDCHEKNRYGATLAGADTAKALRSGLERLKQEIAEAEAKVAEAERLGMEVRGPRFDLRQAFDALTNARSLIHTFAQDPVDEALAEGLGVTSEVKQRAEAALAEHTTRRIWLAATLVPILIVVVLLVMYIRTLPPPAAPVK